MCILSNDLRLSDGIAYVRGHDDRYSMWSNKDHELPNVILAKLVNKCSETPHNNIMRNDKQYYIRREILPKDVIEFVKLNTRLNSEITLRLNRHFYLSFTRYTFVIAITMGKRSEIWSRSKGIMFYWLFVQHKIGFIWLWTRDISIRLRELIIALPLTILSIDYDSRTII